MELTWTSFLARFTELDGQLLIRIQQQVVRDEWTPVVKVITSLGNTGMIWIALSILLLLFRKTRKAGVIALTALAFSFCVNNLFLKEVIGRTRPYDMFPQVRLLIERQTDPSFPSGHAAASFSTAVAMAKNTPKWIGIPAIILAILIALSRLYVGVHYPSDVIAGAISGTICALIVCAIFKLFERRNGNSLSAETGGRHYKSK